MLAKLDELMNIAEENGSAIGSFNVANLESLEAELRAAEESSAPIIIQMAQCHESLVSLDVIGPVMVQLAEKTKVPVCVHLDHGETMDYLEKALEMGFTSIMYDGSTLPYEENLEGTLKAVALAKKYGANVEAELGSMGERENGQGSASGREDEKIYTDPQQAKAFVEASGIDALACSFGTTHGIYLQEPKLNFEIVKEVRRLTGNLPIVMHGGSGVTAEDYRKAIAAGVRKINYFTYMDKAGGTAVSDFLKEQDTNLPIFFSQLAAQAATGMKEHVKEVIKIFSGQ